MFKLAVQKLIRFINILFFKKELPNKISIYFHEISKNEIDDLKKIIVYFQNLDYKFVTIDKFNKEILNDNKHFAITFDDGFSSWTETLKLFEKFNVKATYFLNTIQFTSEAKKKFLPMQPGDVKATAADTSALEEWIGFKPNTSVQEGVSNFVDWYKNFYGI